MLAKTNVPRLYNRAHRTDSYDGEVGSSMTCGHFTSAQLVFKPTFESYRRLSLKPSQWWGPNCKI